MDLMYYPAEYLSCFVLVAKWYYTMIMQADFKVQQNNTAVLYLFGGAGSGKSTISACIKKVFTYYDWETDGIF